MAGASGGYGFQPTASSMPLTYKDFLPQCLSEGFISEPTYERFDVLMASANQWLRRQTNRRVRTVESYEIKRKSFGDILPDKSTFKTYGKTDMRYIRALRLWMVPRSEDDPPEPQQIGHYNVVPTCLDDGGVFSKPTYESYAETLQKLNVHLRNKPIPGKVINLETQDVKLHTGINGRVDPDETFWRESHERGVYFVNILRIFFEVGVPRYGEIGFADFKPTLLEEGGAFSSSKFEPFGAMVSKAARWISQHPDLNVVSVQSCDYKVKGSAAYNSVDTHRTLYHEKGKQYTKYMRILRVGYVVPPPDAGPEKKLQQAVGLTYKTFIPRVVRSGTFSDDYEDLSSLMSRAAHWLHHTGVGIISAETIAVRLDGGHQHGDPEIVFTRIHGEESECKWLYVVRCYFDRHFTEPPREVLPRPPAQQPDDECCILL